MGTMTSIESPLRARRWVLLTSGFCATVGGFSIPIAVMFLFISPHQFYHFVPSTALSAYACWVFWRLQRVPSPTVFIHFARLVSISLFWICAPLVVSVSVNAQNLGFMYGLAYGLFGILSWGCYKGLMWRPPSENARSTRNIFKSGLTLFPSTDKITTTMAKVLVVR